MAEKKAKPNPINSYTEAYISCARAPTKYACDARGNKVAKFDKNYDCEWGVTRRKWENRRERAVKAIANADLGLGITKSLATGFEKMADDIEKNMDPHCKLIKK